MKSFNTTGACFPAVHYMVNIDHKLAEIRKLIDNGSYVVINRPRQYDLQIIFLMFTLTPIKHLLKIRGGNCFYCI